MPLKLSHHWHPTLPHEASQHDESGVAYFWRELLEEA
jgi:hypothetical protein